MKCPAWGMALSGQQYDQCAGTAFDGAGLAVSEHFLTLRQPAEYELFQHGDASGRTVALAMHDAHAALLVGAALG
jgi:hypothetical protein